jgi:threonine dehydrogenase-like Zn-dependent dehydrogenase
MKALVINCPGEMEVKEAAEPKPGAGEVLIRVRASGICGTDVHILEGGFPGAYPLIPGHEFCGEVVEVGPGCSRIKVGDRVAVEPNVPCNNCPECLRGDHHYCRNMIVPGVNRPGGFRRVRRCS